MTTRPPPKNDDREAKLASALRANLRRRKAERGPAATKQKDLSGDSAEAECFSPAPPRDR